MLLAHQELQLYYFLWKWAVPVFGINWFSFVIDIFHPLSLRKARVDESNDWVLKIEDKNLTGWRGNSLKDFRGQWWLEVLALKISDRCRVCILVSDILWKHGMNWNVFFKFASGCLVTLKPQGGDNHVFGWNFSLNPTCCNSSWDWHFPPDLGILCSLVWGNKWKRGGWKGSF